MFDISSDLKRRANAIFESKKSELDLPPGVDELAVFMANRRAAMQPRCDATIDQLQAVSPVGTDEFILYRPNGSGGGQTYKTTASQIGGGGFAGPTLGFLSVVDFGADPLGIADSTGAINACVAAAVAAKTYLVYFPPGIYLVSNTISWPSGITFFGAAPQQTIGYLAATGPTRIVGANLSFDLFYAVNAYGLGWSNLDVAFASLSGSGGRVWHLLNCQNVKMFNCRVADSYSGLYNDSSGDVIGYEIHIGPADLAPTFINRFGFYHTAATGGNPNFSEWNNCDVSQGGTHLQTVDGFVIANGYNSVTLNSGGSTLCKRGLWSKNDGGTAPNFFICNDVTSQNSAVGLQMDDGAVANFNNMLFTSNVATVVISNTYSSNNLVPPITFNNCQLIATNGPAFDLGGSNYSLTITGGNIGGIGGAAGHAIRVTGSALSGAAKNMTINVSGVSIAALGANAAALYMASTFLGIVSFCNNTISTATYGIYIQNGISNSAQITATGNTFTSIGTTSLNWPTTFLNVENLIAHNVGLNPIGVLALPIGTTGLYQFPAVPAANTLYVNPTPFPLVVYLLADLATVTSVGVSWPAGGPDAVCGAPATGQPIRLMPNMGIELASGSGFGTHQPNWTIVAE